MSTPRDSAFLLDGVVAFLGGRRATLIHIFPCLALKIIACLYFIFKFHVLFEQVTQYFCFRRSGTGNMQRQFQASHDSISFTPVTGLGARARLPVTRVHGRPGTRGPRLVAGCHGGLCSLGRRLTLPTWSTAAVSTLPQPAGSSAMLSLRQKCRAQVDRERKGSDKATFPGPVSSRGRRWPEGPTVP